MGVHDGRRERLRTRFGENGPDSFADHEILELLLYYAIPRGDVNPLAHELMDRFGGLSGVFSAPKDLLTQVDGVGERTAMLLCLVPQIAHKARLRDLERDMALNTRDRVRSYVLELFSQERSETVYQICLDGKGKLLSCRRLGDGSACGVNLDIRRIVQNAILCSASSVILAHNHPSGIALPSQADHAATQRAKAALESVDVRLEDHLVIADHDLVSFAESGFLY